MHRSLSLSGPGKDDDLPVMDCHVSAQNIVDVLPAPHQNAKSTHTAKAPSLPGHPDQLRTCTRMMFLLENISTGPPANGKWGLANFDAFVLWRRT